MKHKRKEEDEKGEKTEKGVKETDSVQNQLN
jgi:hypothetical protein